MDSFNNGTNRIVPINTIESGISSNSQIVPAPFCKTEPPFRKVAFVRQISNTTESKTDLLHYISWIFGIYHKNHMY